MGLPDFTPRLLELQAENTELTHKIKIASEYLEQVRERIAFGSDLVDIEMALAVLRRRMM